MEIVALRINRESEKVEGFDKSGKYSEEKFDDLIKAYNDKKSKCYYKKITDKHIVSALEFHDTGNLSYMADEIDESISNAETAINEAVSSLDKFKEIVEAEKLEEIIKISSKDSLHEVIGMIVEKCDNDAILNEMQNDDIVKYFSEYYKTGEK